MTLAVELSGRGFENSSGFQCIKRAYLVTIVFEHLSFSSLSLLSSPLPLLFPGPQQDWDPEIVATLNSTAEVRVWPEYAIFDCCILVTDSVRVCTFVWWPRRTFFT